LQLHSSNSWWLSQQCVCSVTVVAVAIHAVCTVKGCCYCSYCCVGLAVCVTVSVCYDAAATNDAYRNYDDEQMRCCQSFHKQSHNMNYTTHYIPHMTSAARQMTLHYKHNYTATELTALTEQGGCYLCNVTDAIDSMRSMLVYVMLLVQMEGATKGRVLVHSCQRFLTVSIGLRNNRWT
jgi:hypothetical protein